MTASTHILAAPAGNTTASCSPIGNSGKHRLSVSATRNGTAPRATGYILKVVAPDGAAQAGIDLDPSGQFQTNNAAGGWWKYSIEAQYRVPGSTNAWTSSAPQLSVYC